MPEACRFCALHAQEEGHQCRWSPALWVKHACVFGSSSELHSTDGQVWSKTAGLKGKGSKGKAEATAAA